MAALAAPCDFQSLSNPTGLSRWMFSGIGVFYPDGRATQRVGILPDVTVVPSIAGIREGWDELVEEAMRIIREE